MKDPTFERVYSAISEHYPTVTEKEALWAIDAYSQACHTGLASSLYQAGCIARALYKERGYYGRATTLSYKILKHLESQDI